MNNNSNSFSILTEQERRFASELCRSFCFVISFWQIYTYINSAFCNQIPIFQPALQNLKYTFIPVIIYHRNYVIDFSCVQYTCEYYISEWTHLILWRCMSSFKLKKKVMKKFVRLIVNMCFIKQIMTIWVNIWVAKATSSLYYCMDLLLVQARDVESNVDDRKSIHLSKAMTDTGNMGTYCSCGQLFHFSSFSSGNGLQFFLAGKRSWLFHSDNMVLHKVNSIFSQEEGGVVKVKSIFIHF